MEKETTERRNTRPTRQTELGTEVQCSKCKEFWPADSEFFYMKEGKPHSWCKDCYTNDEKTIAKKIRWLAKSKAARQRAAGDRLLVDVFHIDGTPDQMYMTAAERDCYQRTGVLP